MEQLNRYGGEMATVVAAMMRENQAATAALAGARDVEQAVFDEFAARATDSGPHLATAHGDWWYYPRPVAGTPGSWFCRCPRPDDDAMPPEPRPDGRRPGEQALFHVAEPVSWDTARLSPNLSRLAYGVDSLTEEGLRVHIRDARTGCSLGLISGVRQTFAWSARGDHLFYVTADETGRPWRAWRHAVGTGQQADVLVLEEPDERYWLHVGLTGSGAYVTLRSSSASTNEVWLVDAARPLSSPRRVRRREEGVCYQVEHQTEGTAQDRILVLHNRGAPDSAVALGGLDDAPWRPYVDERPGEQLHSMIAFARHLVLYYRRDHVHVLRVLGGNGVAEINLPDEIHAVVPAVCPAFDTRHFRFGYASPVTPDSVYGYDMVSGVLTLLRRRAMPSKPDGTPYRAADYRVTPEWATAEDGHRIPLTVVAPAGDAPRGVVLAGHGRHEQGLTAAFVSARLSLLDRGVAYVMAHVRGSDDYLACARHLVWTGRGTADRLVARGGPLGGSHVLEAVAAAPDAFAAAVVSVPLAREPRLPSRCRLPPVLMVAALDGTVAGYRSSLALIDRLRATGPGGSFQLKSEVRTGGQGRTGRYDRWRQEAFVVAWLLQFTGSSRGNATGTGR
jgi:oligopeptidase B